MFIVRFLFSTRMSRIFVKELLNAEYSGFPRKKN